LNAPNPARRWSYCFDVALVLRGRQRRCRNRFDNKSDSCVTFSKSRLRLWRVHWNTHHLAQRAVVSNFDEAVHQLRSPRRAARKNSEMRNAVPGARRVKIAQLLAAEADSSSSRRGPRASSAAGVRRRPCHLTARCARRLFAARARGKVVGVPPRAKLIKASTKPALQTAISCFCTLGLQRHDAACLAQSSSAFRRARDHGTLSTSWL
jgi:hypothetical protein